MVRIFRLLSRPSIGKGERIITYSEQTQKRTVRATWTIERNLKEFQLESPSTSNIGLQWLLHTEWKVSQDQPHTPIGQRLYRTVR